jgi:hypothetical protein
VIGVVVAKATIENTGFAVPMPDVLKFLGADKAAISKFSPAGLRTWTDTTGKFRIEAELVGVGAGVVELKKKSGETVRVPLAKLSTEDRRLVEE